MSDATKSSAPRLLVPRALRVAVVTAVTVAAGAALVAGTLDACDPSGAGNADAGDAGDGCYRIIGADGRELYRDCPVDGSTCAARIFPDGAVRDGPC